jgi:hypothetical protein
MNTDLLERRRALLEQMDQLPHLVNGTLTEQYFTRRRHGKTVRLGPYYKLQLWAAGKNQTRYVPADQVPRVREGIAHYHRFQDLCQEFVNISAALGEAEPGERKKKRSPRK